MVVGLVVVGLLGVVGRAAVVVVGGGGQLQDRGRAVGLFAARRGLLDPADDFLVVVRLDRLEDELVGVLGKRADGDRELLEVAGAISLSSAVQVTLETASVIFLPCTSRGLSSLLLSIVIFQPGTACGVTEESGWSVGKFTSSFTVEAWSRSLGTLKLSVAYPPLAASPTGWTLTWAAAGPADQQDGGRGDAAA